MSIGKRVLITGATGAIGSWHVLELLKRGYDIICLIRGGDGVGCFNRLAAIIGKDIALKVKIINGDITKPLASLDEQMINELKGKIDIIIHHAGSIKFDRKWQNEIMATNIGGTTNMLTLAEVLGVRYFCYDSTAYALNTEPRNPYEESKQIAEAIVLDWRYGKSMVWRPSIVVGRLSDGVTHGFNGYYGFFSGFLKLKEQLAKKWASDPGQCQEQGFEFNGNGSLVLQQPLYIDYSRESTLNLVAVDWAVASMTNLMEKAKWDTAYNIVDNNPPKVAWVIERSFEILGIEGVRRLSGGINIESVGFWHDVQTSINSQLERFWPYINYEPRFISDVLTPAPTVDLPFITTMLNYAIENKFGYERSK